MKRRTTILLALIVLMLVSSRPAAAQNRYIVQTNGGLSSVLNLCNLLGCQVQGSLDGQVAKTYLVTSSQNLIAQIVNGALNLVESLLGIVSIEQDRLLPIPQPHLSSIASGLSDTAPVNYYGTVVWHGYSAQPAAQIIRLKTLKMVSGSAVRELWLSLTRASTPTTPFFVQFFSKGTTSRETSQVPPNGSTWRGRVITIRGRTSRLASFSNRLPPFWINPRRPFWTVLPMLPLDTER